MPECCGYSHAAMSLYRFLGDALLMKLRTDAVSLDYTLHRPSVTYGPSCPSSSSHEHNLQNLSSPVLPMKKRGYVNQK